MGTKLKVMAQETYWLSRARMETSSTIGTRPTASNSPTESDPPAGRAGSRIRASRTRAASPNPTPTQNGTRSSVIWAICPPTAEATVVPAPLRAEATLVALITWSLG